MTNKNDRRSLRPKETINTEGLKTWQAPDSMTGVTRRLFPTFRVDEADLNAINDYCNSNEIERSVLMRQLIREFLESIKSQ